MNIRICQDISRSGGFWRPAAISASYLSGLCE